MGKAQKREAREAFIQRFNIMATTGRLYGPDELIDSASRYLGKMGAEHPGRTARVWVRDEKFMRSCAGMTPSGVAGEILNRHLRGDSSNVNS